MRKRKERTERCETLKTQPEEGHVEEKGFFACYLLCSLSPRHKGQTYIGFTNNPRRRIRQHNGEITSGAWRTKKKRPWEMILCVYGFPTNVSALQFEWAWQHPRKSLAVKEAAADFKSLSGAPNKIKLLFTMLTLPVWKRLNLTVNFFSTKYKKHSAGCPSLPEQMKVQICPMDELPCYRDGNLMLDENIDDWKDDDDDVHGKGENSENLMQGLMDTSVYDTMENPSSSEKTADEQPEWSEDDGVTQTRNSPTPRKEYHREPFCLVDSPMGTRSITGFFDAVDTVGNDNKAGQSTKPQPTTPEFINNSIILSPEVEVINKPPSTSNSITCFFRKKKRPSVFPKIIDLTKSPDFIQL